MGALTERNDDVVRELVDQGAKVRTFSCQLC
jgi:hypothetical protein